MDWDLQYGELAADTEFTATCEELKANLIEVQKVLDKMLPLRAHYDKMTTHSRIEYDLFMLYTFNSLYFMKLRIEGVDTRNHPIKHELSRIKERMIRWHNIKSQNVRPKLDIPAVKRFVRSGVYNHDATEGTPNKRQKIDDEE